MNPNSENTRPQVQRVAGVRRLRTVHCSNKHTKPYIRVAALNIKGNGGVNINDPRNKWVHINQEMRDRRIAVLIVGEAHLNNERKESITNVFGKLLHIEHSQTPDNPNAKGVAIVLNKRQTNYQNLKQWEVIPGQALQIQIEWHRGKPLTILGIYAPNESGAVNASFWRKISNFYDRNPQVPHPDIMGGDMNIVEDSIDRLPAKEDAEDAVLALDELKTKLKLYDGWRQTYPSERNYTYQHTNLKLARLDRIYVTQSLLESSREWKIEDPAIKTDHRIVSVQVTCEEAPETGRGRWTIPQVVLMDKKFMNYAISELQKTAEEMLEINKRPQIRTEEHNAQTLFETYKTRVREEARKHQKAIVPRIDKEIKRLKTEQGNIVNDNNQNDNEKMRESGIILERIRELNQKCHKKKRKNIRILHRLESETMSKTWTANGREHKPRDQIRALQTNQTATNGDMVYEKDSKEMAGIMRKFYKELQRDGQNMSQADRMLKEQATTDTLERITKRATDVSNEEIQDMVQNQEIDNVIKTAETGKAAGINGLTYEFWKALLNHAK
ncbi:Endonuclease/exonuclease/phosphatase [Armillaria novae-zelandiae]|uniref:Endonuclease/exonuclease/phosphatase n=1 Tax=Armillaria novae-zelandiae TaxID=153914 RepID=A0AA39KH96_9AGAR|nr:Endonuclease/exonuclease/phosphatase [Armillaria novae-zelandiae]